MRSPNLLLIWCATGLYAAGCLPIPPEVVENALLKGQQQSESAEPAAAIHSPPERASRHPPAPPLPPGQSTAQDDDRLWTNFRPFPGELPPLNSDRDLWVVVHEFKASNSEMKKTSNGIVYYRTPIHIEYEVVQGQPEPGVQYVLEISADQYSDLDPASFLQFKVDLTRPRGVIDHHFQQLSPGGQFVARVGRLPGPDEDVLPVSADCATASGGRRFPVHRSRQEYETWLADQRNMLTISNVRIEPRNAVVSDVVVDFKLNRDMADYDYFLIVESKYGIVTRSPCWSDIRFSLNPKANPADRRLNAPISKPVSGRVYCARTRLGQGCGLVVCSNVLALK